MTVAELIAILTTLPQDARVYTDDADLGPDDVAAVLYQEYETGPKFITLAQDDHLTGYGWSRVHPSAGHADERATEGDA